MNDEELLSTAEAARMLALKPQTLRKWRADGTGPKYVRVGSKAVRYRKRALAEYIEESN